MFPVKICEIHSLGRYSREVFVNRCSSAYRTPEMDTRKKGGKLFPPVWSLFSSYLAQSPLRAGTVPVAA